MINQSEHSKISHAKSQRSLSPLCLPCETHQFQMKPYISNFLTYFKDNLHIHYSHQHIELRPYPIALQEFKHAQYMPLFGLEGDKEKFVKNQQLYKSHYDQEKSKMKGLTPKTKYNGSNIPRHTYCQVCKDEFETYERHINEARHIKRLRQSSGNNCLQEYVQSYNWYLIENNKKNELQPFERLLDNLTGLNPLIDKRFDYYLQLKAKLIKRISLK